MQGRRFIDPLLLSKISRLNLIAKLVVEGFISGLHRSPHQGFSIEFTEHKIYTPGDDLKYLDWKVFARTDRYYLKRFQEETNLKCYILLDTSRSMIFGSGEVSKMDYAKFLAASLSYLLTKQKDAVGLLTFNEDISQYLPPKSTTRHLHRILEVLEETKAENKTCLSKIFHALAENIKRRGLIIVISDLFDEPEEVIKAIRHFRHRKHEVIVFHILDPYEISFDFRDLGEFLDLETGERIFLNPHLVREEYWAKLDSFIYQYRKVFSESRVEYVKTDISHPLDIFLLSYLNKRAKL
ncbi:MAG: DUF58 domain-containing protein [Caldiserica bacterium]|nr:DUF58 domain-containing protein [Caldisericota bacterium]